MRSAQPQVYFTAKQSTCQEVISAGQSVVCQDPSLLDNECQKWPQPQFCPTRKSKRCFQRVLSGLEKGGEFRLLTLTSVPGISEGALHSCFRALIKRLRRRGLVEGYVWVGEYTKSGLKHYHVLLRGQYIAQAMLSTWWEELTGAKVVDIRWVRSKKGMARYLVKYMVKDLARYAWDWQWVFRGFVRVWEALKKSCFASGISYGNLLAIWRALLKVGLPWELRVIWEKPKQVDFG